MKQEMQKYMLHVFDVTNFSSTLLRTMSDDQLFYFFLMFSYGFQSFIIIYVNVKLKWN
jgi:hypothetical protein